MQDLTPIDASPSWRLFRVLERRRAESAAPRFDVSYCPGMSPPTDTTAQRRPVSLLHGLADDLHPHPPARAGTARALRLVGWYVYLMLSPPSLRAGLLYRVSHWFAFRFGVLGGVCSAMIHWLSRRLYCCSIAGRIARCSPEPLW
jgi:hypothetical protein